MKNKKKRFTAWLIVIAVFAQFFVLHRFWLTQAGAFLIHEDAIAPAGAIVVLGGGKAERVFQGVELYKRKFADRIIFTGEFEQYPGMDEQLHWARQAQKLAEKLGVPRTKMVTILNSLSTHDDAVLVKEICKKDGITSIIVVTEPFHTRRAWCAFRKVYRDSGIKVTVYPVQDSWYKKNTWWTTEHGLLSTNSEYIKMVYYLIKGYI